MCINDHDPSRQVTRPTGAQVCLDCRDQYASRQNQLACTRRLSNRAAAARDRSLREQAN